MSLLQNIKYVLSFYSMYFLVQILVAESTNIRKICIVWK